MARYIDADEKVHIQVFDNEHEEYTIIEKTIGECLDLYTDEGCPETITKIEMKEDEQAMTETKQKTMMEDFFEKFPDAPRGKSGEPCTCPVGIYFEKSYEECDSFSSNDSTCIACWSRPVPHQRECYKNVTIIVEYDKNGEPNISWVRQEDTERIGYKEAMKRVMKMKAKENK